MTHSFDLSIGSGGRRIKFKVTLSYTMSWEVSLGYVTYTTLKKKSTIYSLNKLSSEVHVPCGKCLESL